MVKDFDVKPSVEEKIMIERLELLCKKLSDPDKIMAVKWAIKSYWNYKKNMTEMICQQTIETAQYKKERVLMSIKNQQLVAEKKEFSISDKNHKV